jgi:hypothetical protein
MGTSYDDVAEVALSIPPGRERLWPNSLLESLDSPERERKDLIWVQEAERRAAQIEEGMVEALPGQDVMDELRARLKR